LIAFDTNILIYAQQVSEDLRHRKAIELLYNASLLDACIPTQVLGEFLNVCIRKLKLPPVDAVDQIDEYARIFSTPETSHIDLTDAAHLVAKHNLQFFDALIIAVSARVGATILLSEDMRDGLEVDGLRVVNPFAPGNDGFLADYFTQSIL
jgi:predicted nucleic acid-binding protein